MNKPRKPRADALPAHLKRIQRRIMANSGEITMVKGILDDPLKTAYISDWFYTKNARISESFLASYKQGEKGTSKPG